MSWAKGGCMAPGLGLCYPLAFRNPPSGDGGYGEGIRGAVCFLCARKLGFSRSASESGRLLGEEVLHEVADAGDFFFG